MIKNVIVFLLYLMVSINGAYEYSLNFYDKHSPRLAYGFASNDSSDRIRFRISTEDFAPSLPNYLALEDEVIFNDSISLNAKDSIFMESKHVGSVTHTFVFDMSEINTLIDGSVIEEVHYKYCGQAEIDSGSSRIHFALPQVGHYWLWRDFSDTASFSIDTVDTQSIMPSWLGNGHDMDLVMYVATDPRSAEVTLRTDFMELILVLDNYTSISLEPKQLTRQNHIKIISSAGISPSEIVYTIDKPQNITLDVYSPAGKKLRSLTQGYRLPGSHHIYWDGTDYNGQKAPHGTYLFVPVQ